MKRRYFTWDADTFVLGLLAVWWCGQAFGWPNTLVRYNPEVE